MHVRIDIGEDMPPRHVLFHCVCPHLPKQSTTNVQSARAVNEHHSLYIEFIESNAFFPPTPHNFFFSLSLTILSWGFYREKRSDKKAQEREQQKTSQGKKIERKKNTRI